ncbi:AraC family transcriptional regulator [Williamsia limnetica]|uniref:AraC family transcriptional regulator n=1 Tax=Williamsia limnetica TaxID=882452 RepID=A0A318S514_WILLI|nr:helix-turn-helix domain-containing protein [Williamsia limnetica]PYE19239.1 AraC family transcriptional regulator [Williamsia limnetica]
MVDDGRPIRPDERSGVLTPTNLERFAANWFDPADAARKAVDTYWSVSWHLPAGQTISQKVLEFPAITVSIESGSVAFPYVVTAVQRRAWTRTIEGSGEVFAIRLRPAGLAVVSDLDPRKLPPEQPITAALDPGLFELVEAIAREGSPAARARRADAVIEGLLSRRPPSPEHVLANTVVDALDQRVRARTGPLLAAQIGVSERAMQRALSLTLGMGPKAVARRIRLQEVVRRFSSSDACAEVDAAAVANDLGYADQSHLINDFRSVTGMSPGAYLRALRALSQTPG